MGRASCEAELAGSHGKQAGVTPRWYTPQRTGQRIQLSGLLLQQP